MGEGFTFTGVRVADADAEWLIIEKGKDLQPITPDGDKSPFEMISFLTTRKAQVITTGQSSSSSSGDDEEEEEYIDSNSTFYFTPGNSQFKLTQGNTADHYECKGYMESNGLQPSKILATLTFDIEKATGMVEEPAIYSQL